MSFAERRTKSSRDDWRTPPEEIALVKRIFGGAIDLDPCASPYPEMQFARHSIAERGGLVASWGGNVFINPPYGRAILDWTRKGRADASSEHTTAQIWLVPGRAMDSKWWRELMAFCPVFAIKKKRIKFDGTTCGAMFPSALCYCGPDEARFIDEVEKAGWTVYRKVTK